MIVKFLKDKRNIVLLLLFVLFSIKTAEAENRFVLWALAGVSFSACLDFLINRLFHKKTIFPRSAMITGFIVSGVLDYGHYFPALLFFCSLAIMSKYIVKVKKRHIFNPANLGLFFAAILQFTLAWTIESNVYLIIIAGMYIAYSIRKLPHVAGFLITFVLLFKFVEGINPFLLISWFFVFVMLVEPKTSGYGVLRGIVFGGIAGLASFLFYRFLPGRDFFVLSLFVANIFNPVFDKLFFRTGGQKVVVGDIEASEAGVR
ncbi:MAG: hypothetical protein ABIJ11_04720 [Elusimicrobiota bacterium]